MKDIRRIKAQKAGLTGSGGRKPRRGKEAGVSGRPCFDVPGPVFVRSESFEEKESLPGCRREKSSSFLLATGRINDIIIRSNLPCECREKKNRGPI
ncbi:hypothetical protein CLS_27230 [[Clostridium] cf. saccharolyticum K10]|nr:hypothetical protein CLS_27230 [[Clostridium] cf. saccharolyticum K10]